MSTIWYVPTLSSTVSTIDVLHSTSQNLVSVKAVSLPPAPAFRIWNEYEDWPAEVPGWLPSCFGAPECTIKVTTGHPLRLHKVPSMARECASRMRLVTRARSIDPSTHSLSERHTCLGMYEYRPSRVHRWWFCRVHCQNSHQATRQRLLGHDS